MVYILSHQFTHSWTFEKGMDLPQKHMKSISEKLMGWFENLIEKLGAIGRKLRFQRIGHFSFIFKVIRQIQRSFILEMFGTIIRNSLTRKNWVKYYRCHMSLCSS
jgi:hypothetical protein